MEMNQSNKLAKYWAVSAAALLVTAFAFVQPTMQVANAVGIEGLPAYDECSLRTDNGEVFPDDGISMNTVKRNEVVKTIHAEKEIYDCYLNQGHLPIIVDVTTYLEVYENITSHEVISTNAISTTCLKDETTATVIDCESDVVPTSPVFVNNCNEQDVEFPQEMNTVNRAKAAKTIESQKEVFLCQLSDGTQKKVDIVLFTEIYEDLNTQTTTAVQFLSARCVVLVSDTSSSSTEGDLQDADVETCIFNEIEN